MRKAMVLIVYVCFVVPTAGFCKTGQEVAGSLEFVEAVDKMVAVDDAFQAETQALENNRKRLGIELNMYEQALGGEKKGTLKYDEIHAAYAAALQEDFQNWKKILTRNMSMSGDKLSILGDIDIENVLQNDAGDKEQAQKILDSAKASLEASDRAFTIFQGRYLEHLNNDPLITQQLNAMAKVVDLNRKYLAASERDLNGKNSTRYFLAVKINEMKEALNNLYASSSILEEMVENESHLLGVVVEARLVQAAINYGSRTGLSTTETVDAQINSIKEGIDRNGQHLDNVTNGLGARGTGSYGNGGIRVKATWTR